MRTRFTWGVLVLSVVLSGVPFWLIDAANSAKGADSAKAPEKAPRLPNHFGKLGLSDEQKEKVFSIQSKYDEELKALKERLKKLQAEEQQEFETLLTPEQRSRLELLRTESRKKSASSGSKK